MRRDVKLVSEAAASGMGIPVVAGRDRGKSVKARNHKSTLPNSFPVVARLILGTF